MEHKREKSRREAGGGKVWNKDYQAFGIAFTVIAILQAVQVLAFVAFCVWQLG